MIAFWAIVVGFWLGNIVYGWDNESAMAVIAYLVCAMYAGVDFILCLRRLIERSS